MRYILNGTYENGDLYGEAFTDLFEMCQAVVEINERFHDLESVNYEASQIINPYSLELEIDH